VTTARRLIQLTASLGLVGGVVVVGAAQGGSTVVGRSISTDSAAQILAITKAATTHAGSFTVNCSGASPSIGLTGSAVTNVEAAVGSQFTKDTVRGFGVATVATRFIGGVVYFKGNAVQLQLQFGVAHSKYANKWISVRKGQKDFTEIAAGMTLASAMVEIAPVGPLSKSKVETFAGKSVVAVIGKVSPDAFAGAGAQHTFVAVAAPNRPAGITVSTVDAGHAYHGTCLFTNWKHKFVVTKPSSSISITKTNL
jgi:hypothetical protein